MKDRWVVGGWFCSVAARSYVKGKRYLFLFVPRHVQATVGRHCDMLFHGYDSLANAAFRMAIRIRPPFSARLGQGAASGLKYCQLWLAQRNLCLLCLLLGELDGAPLCACRQGTRKIKEDRRHVQNESAASRGF